MVEERQFVGLIKDRMTELTNSVCNPVVLWCLEFVNCKQFNDVQKGDMYVNYVWKGNVLYILIIFLDTDIYSLLYIQVFCSL